MAEGCKLAERECVPCKGDVPPLTGMELDAFQSELDERWTIVDEHHLERSFRFKTYAEAVEFTNKVAGIAEEQQHHPDIHLAYGKVKVQVWTHKASGLTANDFVFAAKVDRL